MESFGTPLKNIEEEIKMINIELENKVIEKLEELGKTKYNSVPRDLDDLVNEFS